MYLSRLEINGFKSFAKKTILSFPKLEFGKSNITAIVGPNGSGKSNVADSIRWVTGEQSLKTLRGKKSEDVIFSGTSKTARLGCAEVSLYLDNSDRKIPTGIISPEEKLRPANYPELVITRKLYRNGESEYLINKSKARLNDILLLMAELSFGQKSYSVIGQGMADSILSASPSERKDFLNEAAGIKQYQLKRNQAFVKLESTKENLEQAERLIQEIEPRLRSLTRQIKRLKKREELERELHRLQIDYYSSLWQTISSNWAKERRHLDGVALERKKVQTQTVELQERLEHLARNTASGDQFKELQQNYYNLNSNRNQLLQKKSELSSKLALQKEKNKFEQETASLVALSSSETKALIENLKEIKNLEQKLLCHLSAKDTQNSSDLAEQIIKKIEKIIKAIEKEDKQDEKQSEAKKKEIENYLLEIERGLSRLEQEISSQDEELKKAQEALMAYSQEHKKEREELVFTQKGLQKIQNELNKFISMENEVKVELARIETKKEDLEAEIRKELGSPDKLAHQSIKTLNENELETTIRPKIDSIKRQLELIGGIDKEIIKEYQETQKRYDFLSSQTEDLKQASESLEKLIKKLEETIKEKFDASFEKINQEFQKFFKILFNGGAAKLIYTKEIILAPQSAMVSPQEMRDEKETIRENSSSPEKIREDKKKNSLTTFDSDSSTIIKEAVEIEATPPGKKLKSINMLSGGERALTSIALICAIIANNPSPFVILDEVDAALDEANSVRFADILEKLSHKTQFVVISHNRATMEKARVLYGITMADDGVSKLLSVKLEEVKAK